jgi:hypothetical protein
MIAALNALNRTTSMPTIDDKSKFMTSVASLVFESTPLEMLPVNSRMATIVLPIEHDIDHELTDEQDILIDRHRSSTASLIDVRSTCARIEQDKANQHETCLATNFDDDSQTESRENNVTRTNVTAAFDTTLQPMIDTNHKTVIIPEQRQRIDAGNGIEHHSMDVIDDYSQRNIERHRHRSEYRNVKQCVQIVSNEIDRISSQSNPSVSSNHRLSFFNKQLLSLLR